MDPFELFGYLFPWIPSDMGLPWSWLSVVLPFTHEPRLP